MKNVQLKNAYAEEARLPQSYPMLKLQTNPISSISGYESYRLGGAAFGRLANATECQKIKTKLIEIDIRAECNLLTPQGLLEITVPVIGLTDLFNKTDCLSRNILYPNIVAVNAFGAKETEDKSFPYADFINVVDIVDNRYEIIPSKNGELELPQQGTGLFSIIKEITYLLSAEQVLQGNGLENLEHIGIKKGKLYLLPPIGTDESFTLHVCCVHIDDKNRRIVDTIREVVVNFKEEPIRWDTQRSALHHFDSDPNEKKYVDLEMKLKSDFLLSRPILLEVTLEPNSKVSYEPSYSNGWTQHPVMTNKFSKRYGLRQETLRSALKVLYNEYDFMRDCLTFNSITLPSVNDYNNFLLRPEAFGRLYDSLIHDVARGYITGDFIVDRIMHDQLTEVDFSHITVDFHDSVVLDELELECKNGKERLLSYLLDNKNTHSQKLINDGFFVSVNGNTDFCPSLQVAVVVEATEEDEEAIIDNFIEGGGPFSVRENSLGLQQDVIINHALQLNEVMDFSHLGVPTRGLGSDNANVILNYHDTKQDTTVKKPSNRDYSPNRWEEEHPVVIAELTQKNTPKRY